MINLPICYLGNQLDPVWKTCVKILGPSDVLPIPDHIEWMYLDYETTSERLNVASINPHSDSIDDSVDGTSGELHRDCKICGVSVLFDDEPSPYYVPVRHAYLDDNGEYQYRNSNLPNIQPERVYDWLRILMRKAKIWANQIIKYDFHVQFNEAGIIPTCKLIDTANVGKLAAFPERFNYNLTELMRLIDIDIYPYEERVKAFLGKKLKDYGLVPPDIMAPYAGVDTLSVRKIIRELYTKTKEECSRVMELEEKIIPLLIQMEQIGVRTDLKKCQYDCEKLLPRQARRIKKIKQLSGFNGFRPDKEASVYELFVDVLGWDMPFTKKSVEKLEKGLIKSEEANLSFGYDAIIRHYDKNPRLVTYWLNYQEDDKLLNSFTFPYLERHTSSDGRMHCSFNQLVRTGRMSCTAPNMTQLSKRSKEYILPFDDDYVLVDFDLSQIEFRMIIHYIQNQKAINAYRADPKTDFHTWVSLMCGIPRDAAKNINFMLGYGGGKKKCVAMLSEHPDIVKTLKTREEIEARAYEVYSTYHRTLPELKSTSYRAGDVLKSRGFVRTLLGRRRYLPYEFHYKSFNSVSQGSAADFHKDITRRLQKFISMDCLLQAVIHDSWVFSIKKNRVNELVPLIKREIEKPIEGVEFSVPIVSEFGISAKNWRDCGKKIAKNSLDYWRTAV